MAGAVMRWRSATTGLALLAASVSPALAAGPADPFSPPPILQRKSSDASGPPGPAATATANSTADVTSLVDSGAPPAATANSGISGVRVGRAPAALINGQWISVGQAVGDALLQDVSLTGVTLRHANGRREQLHLSPGIQLGKSPVAAPRAAESKR